MNRKWIALMLSTLLLLTVAAACGMQDRDTDLDSNLSGTGGMTDPNGMGDVTNPGGATGNGRNATDSTRTGTGNNGTGTGSDLNGNGPSDSNTHLSGKREPVFPNSLATTDAEVAVDDLIATLGLSETDLDTAMRNVSTVGDGVDGARTYRHKLLGHDSDVSYSFDKKHAIDRVTVKTMKDYADDWRREFKDTLRATAVEGKEDAWDYSESAVQMREEGDHFIITIEKPKA